MRCYKAVAPMGQYIKSAIVFKVQHTTSMVAPANGRVFHEGIYAMLQSCSPYEAILILSDPIADSSVVMDPYRGSSGNYPAVFYFFFIGNGAFCGVGSSF